MGEGQKPPKDETTQEIVKVKDQLLGDTALGQVLLTTDKQELVTARTELIELEIQADKINEKRKHAERRFESREEILENDRDCLRHNLNTAQEQVKRLVANKFEQEGALDAQDIESWLIASLVNEDLSQNELQELLNNRMAQLKAMSEYNGRILLCDQPSGELSLVTKSEYPVSYFIKNYSSNTAKPELRLCMSFQTIMGARYVNAVDGEKMGSYTQHDIIKTEIINGLYHNFQGNQLERLERSKRLLEYFERVTSRVGNEEHLKFQNEVAGSYVRSLVLLGNNHQDNLGSGVIDVMCLKEFPKQYKQFEEQLSVLTYEISNPEQKVHLIENDMKDYISLDRFRDNNEISEWLQNRIIEIVIVDGNCMMSRLDSATNETIDWLAQTGGYILDQQASSKRNK